MQAGRFVKLGLKTLRGASPLCSFFFMHSQFLPLLLKQDYLVHPPEVKAAAKQVMAGIPDEKRKEN